MPCGASGAPHDLLQRDWAPGSGPLLTAPWAEPIEPEMVRGALQDQRRGAALAAQREEMIRTISIGTGQPKRFNIRLMSLMPSVLATLLSMTIFRGRFKPWR